jgi:hypothetical protein
MKITVRTLREVISDNCTDGKMSTSQMRDTLKVAQQLSRLTKRLTSDRPVTAMFDVWEPKKWSDLAQKLSSSEHYKSSPSLPSTCHAIAKLAESSIGGNQHVADGKVKRKGGEDEGGEKKVKRKKIEVNK